MGWADVGDWEASARKWIGDGEGRKLGGGGLAEEGRALEPGRGGKGSHCWPGGAQLILFGPALRCR